MQSSSMGFDPQRRNGDQARSGTVGTYHCAGEWWRKTAGHGNGTGWLRCENSKYPEPNRFRALPSRRLDTYNCQLILARTLSSYGPLILAALVNLLPKLIWHHFLKIVIQSSIITPGI